jgi:hypothetical protein
MRASREPQDQGPHADSDELAERIVADWPPLTDAQLDRIAALLRAGGAA